MILTKEALEIIEEKFFKKQSTQYVKVYFKVNDLLKNENNKQYYILPINNSIFNYLNFHLIKDQDILSFLNLTNKNLYIPCLNYLELDINCPFCIAQSIYKLKNIYTFNNIFLIMYRDKKYFILYDQEYLNSIKQNFDNYNIAYLFDLDKNTIIKRINPEDMYKQIKTFNKDNVFNIYKRQLNLVVENIDNIIDIIKNKI